MVYLYKVINFRGFELLIENQYILMYDVLKLQFILN